MKRPAALKKLRVEEAPLHDLGPETAALLAEALDGLSRPQKRLPCKLFYDRRGSELFERICALDEYYPTRTEIAIMRESIVEMSEMLGRGCALVEYGSGSSLKTRLLLERVENPACYVPVDISREFLLRSADELRAEFPAISVIPVCADYTAPLTLPTLPPHTRRVVYFPGSTIGNFEPKEAKRFLETVSKVCGRDGGLLIGVDLRKDPAVLHAAYNDAEGVTAEFNLNILARLNRELGARFDLQKFRHKAFFNDRESRIEMHLESIRSQLVRIDGTSIHFREGETIHTECSYKYSLESFASLAQEAGLGVRRVWTDSDGLFSVQYLEPGACRDGYCQMER